VEINNAKANKTWAPDHCVQITRDTG